jgi:hypothetical protein
MLVDSNQLKRRDSVSGQAWDIRLLTVTPSSRQRSGPAMEAKGLASDRSDPTLGHANVLDASFCGILLIPLAAARRPHVKNHLL